MASIKYGAIASEIKGKVGGSVFQSSKSGFSVKNKPSFGSKLTKADAGRDLDGTIEHKDKRIGMPSVANQWPLLSQEQQSGWNSAAINFPFKNKFGDSYIGSGFQVFVQLNTNLINLNLNIRVTPPTPSAPIVPALITPGLNPGDPLLFTFIGGIQDSASIQVFATSAGSKGRGLVKGKLKNIGFVDSTYGPDVDFTQAYEWQFGSNRAGGIVYFVFIATDVTTGQQSEPTVVGLNINATGSGPVISANPDVLSFRNSTVGIARVVPTLITSVEFTISTILTLTGVDAALFTMSFSASGPWVSTLTILPNAQHYASNVRVYVRCIPVAAVNFAANLTAVSDALNTTNFTLVGNGV